MDVSLEKREMLASESRLELIEIDCFLVDHLTDKAEDAALLSDVVFLRGGVFHQLLIFKRPSD